MDPAEIALGVTRCYIQAESEKNAIIRLKQILVEEHLKFLEIEWCVNNEEVEWEKPDDPTAKTRMAEAESSDSVKRYSIWRLKRNVLYVELFSRRA